jgi:hypothetical protein
MECPNCQADLQLWEWADDREVRGLYCPRCKLELQSESFSRAVTQARTASDNKLLEQSTLPEDSVIDCPTCNGSGWGGPCTDSENSCLVCNCSGYIRYKGKATE